MKTCQFTLTILVLVAIMIAGCDKSVDTAPAPTQTVPEETDVMSLQTAAWPPNACPAPGPTVTVEFGADALTSWPYTGHDFSGDPVDPVNLIFFGEADPRDIRAALMSLDGDRSAFGFPAAAPFNSTWSDAIGDVQNSYASGAGWLPGAIQLACGDYEPARFHLRLFKAGRWTLGGVHFEVLIPGTTDHQVLSWELAEQFVVVDLMRSGLLDGSVPMMPTDPINDSPFRTIPAVIYNELVKALDPGLIALIGGPPGPVTEDVPIWTDGTATLLNLANRVEREAGVWCQDLVIEYGLTVPKPFCSSGPYDYVLVEGPVHMHQTTQLTRCGRYMTSFRATGELSVTPIDPMTGLPSGETLSARVIEFHNSLYGDRIQNASSLRYQAILPFGAEGSGWFFERFRIGSRGGNGYQLLTRCEPQSAPTPDLVAQAPSLELSESEPVRTVVTMH